jgi:hypothetical protein
LKAIFLLLVRLALKLKFYDLHATVKRQAGGELFSDGLKKKKKLPQRYAMCTMCL